MTDSEWYYEGAENGGRVLAKDDRKTIIHEPPRSPFNEQAMADAKLIAAAPDMLAALGREVVLLAWLSERHPSTNDEAHRGARQGASGGADCSAAT